MPVAYRNHHCRLKEFIADGRRLLYLENERLQVGILVDKGADIFSFVYKPTDTEFMLHTPWGRRPLAAQSLAPAGSTFLDTYEGGWQEILPNGGPAAVYGGAGFGQHGEISTIPWDLHIEVDTPAQVQVMLAVRPYRSPFHVQRRLTLRRGEPFLTIDDVVTNEGREPLDLMWGHHPAFGPPFLGPACRVDLPAGDLILETFAGQAGTRLAGGGRHTWPLVEENGQTVDFSRPDSFDSGQEDLGYVLNLPAGWYALTNQESAVGFAMAWSLETFPYLWVWRQFNRAGGYPWYGRVYTMALEPWSSYPSAGLPAAVANGSALRLAGGESRRARLVATAFQGLRRVTHVSEAGEISGNEDIEP